MNDPISRADLFDELNRRGVPYNAEVNMVINGMPSAQQWIPCSERPPEAECGESDNVLTTCAYKDAVKGYRRVEKLYYNGGVWCYPTGETFEGKVLAWMPLPEPYKGEQP